MTTGAIIVARMSSTRLPGKNMLPILGKPMIERMVERIRAAQKVDAIIIATSTEPSDDVLVDCAQQIGAFCYRGPLDNVMERIIGAAKEFFCDSIIELLGDNPLVHADLIDDVVELYEKSQCDYVSSLTREYPPDAHAKKLFACGIRVQVYKRSVAEQYRNYPLYLNNPEKHPCAFIFEHPEQFKVGYLEAIGPWETLNRPELNFAVNYEKNYTFVQNIFEKLYSPQSHFTLQQVMAELEKQPALYTLLGAE